MCVAAQAEVGAGQVRVPERRPLGQQVGQHHEPVAARWAAAPPARAPRRRRPPSPRRPGRRAPASRRPSAGRSPPLLIAPPMTQTDVGQRVAEQRPAGVDVGRVHGHADGAAGSEREPGDARRHRSGAEVAQRPVGRRRPRRCTGGQTDLARRGSSQSQRSRGGQDRRKPVRLDAAQRQSPSCSRCASTCRAGRCPMPTTAR